MGAFWRLIAFQLFENARAKLKLSKRFVKVVIEINGMLWTEGVYVFIAKKLMLIFGKTERRGFVEEAMTTTALKILSHERGMDWDSRDWDERKIMASFFCSPKENQSLIILLD